MLEQFNQEIETVADDDSRENKWDQSTFFGFFWWEIVGDLIKHFVVISDTEIIIINRALIEVNLQSTEFEADFVAGSGILYVDG